MLELFNILLEQITQHAYLGIAFLLIASAVGLPLPEDIIVMAAGVLAHREVIHPVWAWVVCYGAILIADWIVFFIGWHFGKAVLHRRWIKRMLHPRRLLWARRQVHAHGAWVIVGARFIPGVRWPTILTAGMMHLRPWKFALADTPTLVASVSLQFTLGWLFSKSISQLMSYRDEFALSVAGVGVLILLLYTLIRYVQSTRRRLRSSFQTTADEPS